MVCAAPRRAHPGDRARSLDPFATGVPGRRRSHRAKKAVHVHRLRVDLGAHCCALNAPGVDTRPAKDFATACRQVPLAAVRNHYPCRARTDAAGQAAWQAVSGGKRTMSRRNREPESPRPAAAPSVVRRPHPTACTTIAPPRSSHAAAASDTASPTSNKVGRPGGSAAAVIPRSPRG